MTFILLTFKDGTPVYVNKENIAWFSKAPGAQYLHGKWITQIMIVDGHPIFVREEVEEVKKLLDENN